jgi:hypothetical protein
MAKETKKSSKSHEEILAEIHELSKRADETSSKQLDLPIGDEDIDPVISSNLFKDTADPEKSHRLYYGIQRLLRDYLPKGDENRRLREYVYKEKNLFLNRGIEINEQTGRRGSDSRMAYIPNFLEVAFNEVGKWISAGSNSFDIYKAFWDLNEERGYHKEKGNPTQFDKILKAITEVPKPEK